MDVPVSLAESEALARKIAMDRLAERDRSRAELRQALDKRRVPAQVSEVLLDKLEAANLLDDERFAFAWVEARTRTKGLGKAALVRELRLKGIAEHLIDTVLAARDPEEDRAAAHRLVQRRLRRVAGLPHEVQLRRLTSMLMRKGHSPSLAVEVVRTELDAEWEPDLDSC